MKKYYFVFLLLISVRTNAQWVSIPDTNFGTWLNTNGYSACLQGNNSIGWQMDTACSAVVNEDTIDCSFAGISNLTGIQYFDNLKLLGCSYNQLASLSILPHGLTWLGCTDNQLNGLPTLPNSLVELYCTNNHITSLPALPNGLVWLFCDGNQISNLPTLPTNLEWLDCSYNQISTMPTLPVNLVSLACSYNSISSLPSLPVSLVGLGCANNHLVNLPNLPSGLTGLTCNNNQLTDLPELPLYLYACVISDNPTLTCLPQLHTIDNFEFSNIGISCLPNYGNILNSTPAINSFPVCDSANNTHGCQTFSSVQQIEYASLDVYPNPVSNFIQVNGIVRHTPLTITNLLGQTLFHMTSENESLTIDVSALPDGFYFLNRHKFIKGQ